MRQPWLRAKLSSYLGGNGPSHVYGRSERNGELAKGLSSFPRVMKGQPALEVESASFDFRTLRLFTRLLADGRSEEAVKLMSESVQWHAFDGQVIKGRKGCQGLFEQQKMQGLKRKVLSDWVVQRKKQDDPDYDDHLDSFTAKRIISHDKPGTIPARLVQTLTLKRGLITRGAMKAALWEPDLESLELLRRFSSLRATNKDDQALVCLDSECEWKGVTLPELFIAPPEPSAASLKGRDSVRRLWAEQRKQGVSRAAQSDWKEEDASALESPAGEIFSREVRITGHDGVTTRLFRQIAQIANGRIVAMRHVFVSE